MKFITYTALMGITMGTLGKNLENGNVGLAFTSLICGALTVAMFTPFLTFDYSERRIQTLHLAAAQAITEAATIWIAATGNQGAAIATRMIGLALAAMLIGGINRQARIETAKEQEQ